MLTAKYQENQRSQTINNHADYRHQSIHFQWSLCGLVTNPYEAFEDLGQMLFGRFEFKLLGSLNLGVIYEIFKLGDLS